MTSIVLYNKKVANLSERSQQMDLEGKMELFRSECDPEDLRQLKAIFSPDELRKLYGRFRTARKHNEKVDQHYDTATSYIHTSHLHVHTVGALNKEHLLVQKGLGRFLGLRAPLAFLGGKVASFLMYRSLGRSPDCTYKHTLHTYIHTNTLSSYTHTHVTHKYHTYMS